MNIKIKAHTESYSANILVISWFDTNLKKISMLLLNWRKKSETEREPGKLLCEKNNPDRKDLSLDCMDSATTRGMTMVPQYDPGVSYGSFSYAVSKALNAVFPLLTSQF